MMYASRVSSSWPAVGDLLSFTRPKLTSTCTAPRAPMCAPSAHTSGRNSLRRHLSARCAARAAAVQDRPCLPLERDVGETLPPGHRQSADPGLQRRHPAWRSERVALISRPQRATTAAGDPTAAPRHRHFDTAVHLGTNNRIESAIHSARRTAACRGSHVLARIRASLFCRRNHRCPADVDRRCTPGAGCGWG